MVYGIISDIHGNLEALNEVLLHLKDVDEIICLGDIVSYGANPNECCEIIKNSNCVCVIGNHDLASIDKYDITYFNPYAKDAILWTKKELNQENKKFLENINELIVFQEKEKNFTLVHGSLEDPPTVYITSPWEAGICFNLLKTKICFIGHTHVAEYYQKKEDSPFIRHIQLWSGGVVEIQDGFQYIVNCGSVGQPRDSNPQASFGIFNLDKKEILIKRIDYKINIAQDKIKSAGLPSILYQRLGLGR
jgi:predicted phosphodiesterase